MEDPWKIKLKLAFLELSADHQIKISRRWRNTVQVLVDAIADEVQQVGFQLAPAEVSPKVAGPVDQPAPAPEEPNPGGADIPGAAAPSEATGLTEPAPPAPVHIDRASDPDVVRFEGQLRAAFLLNTKTGTNRRELAKRIQQASGRPLVDCQMLVDRWSAIPPDEMRRESAEVVAGALGLALNV